jgi:hypothetical protein
LGTTEKLVNAAQQAIAAAGRETKSETLIKLLMAATSKLELTQDEQTAKDARGGLAVEADHFIGTVLGDLHRSEPD